ncbi:Mth938-like domain-containing protein [Melaminivora jejuensis]|uniref:Mth938-like domain-containing protein n=1 Tax=Melaminivora jejuensis TaxID=1267217 RepID=UPI001ADFCCA1|nr:Mth938-like domain-containing protein [Melaminivora jejuensis]UHJ64007.1 Mth938-like domain-containing protein [Melaminivora jejuensis]
MKFQPDRFETNAITAYGPGWIAVDGERTTASTVLSSRGPRLDWHCTSFADLTPEHFKQLIELEPEVIVFGSGSRLRFPAPAWLAPLMRQRIGVESMDTQAACRTYNILAGEGRHVVAALLLEA